MKERNAKHWLRAAFIAGAVVDALALLPMLIPALGKIFWGFEESTGGYYYAMWSGAALMLGWTLLLIWGCRKPLERRSLAPLTVVVIIGIAAAEIVSAALGTMSFEKILPSLVIQAILTALFVTAYVKARGAKQ